MTLRILLADDHLLFAEAIREFLGMQRGMTVVGVATTGADAVRKAVETNPDIVLMDHFMPDVNGTEATRLIKARNPEIRILMMSAGSSHAQMLRALRAGASGFITKWCPASQLLAAIREVRAGRHYIQPELADAMLGRLIDAREEHDPLARLSARERQVLQMLAEGRGISAIASALFLSPRTVETYRLRLIRSSASGTCPSWSGSRSAIT